METCTFTPVSAEIAQFLDHFDRLSSAATSDAASLFADSFQVLDASGAHTLTPTVLMAALPARRALFESAGVTQVQRGEARELPLDDLHRLVNVEWSALRPGGPVLLSSSFVLRREAEKWRVVVYINHTDPRAALSAAPAKAT